jgi:hypothetical protein
MQTLQLILCRGAVDRAFLGELLDSPSEALREYDLTSREFAVLAESSARSLVDLAVAVEAYRRGEPARANVRELALVG